MIHVTCDEEALEKRYKERGDDKVTLDEIKKLDPGKVSLTASRIIGVREISGYLKGEYDIDRAKYLMQLNTRHLAKRQLTWFRKDKRLTWILIKEKKGWYLGK